MQREFIMENFSHKNLLFINRMIDFDETKCPPIIRNNYNIHDLLIKVVKTLMLNELEIIYLSFFLDKMGWSNDGDARFSFYENLLYTGIAAKVISYLN